MVMCSDDAMHATDARRKNTLAVLGGRRGSSRLTRYWENGQRKKDKGFVWQSINWSGRERFGWIVDSVSAARAC